MNSLEPKKTSISIPKRVTIMWLLRTHFRDIFLNKPMVFTYLAMLISISRFFFPEINKSFIRFSVTFCFSCSTFLMLERLVYDLKSIVNDQNLRKKISVEFLGYLLSFLLPKKIRENTFEPFFEELKEDRIRARQVRNRLGKIYIELAFAFRLIVTFLQSLVCWAGDFLSKMSPILKWIIGG